MLKSLKILSLFPLNFLSKKVIICDTIDKRLGRYKMKLEQNERPLLFSETTIPDIFFSEHLAQMPGDYLKVYLYIIFLSKYGKDVKINDLSKKLNIPLKTINDGIKFLEENNFILKKSTG